MTGSLVATPLIGCAIAPHRKWQMDTKNPPVIPEGLMPSSLVLVQPPTVEGISWRFLYRLRGDIAQPGHPLYEERDAIQVRIRPDKQTTSHWIWFPSGSDFVFPEHVNKYGGPETLVELVQHTLTQGTLRGYAKWLASRYATRLEAQMRKDSGL